MKILILSFLIIMQTYILCQQKSSIFIKDNIAVNRKDDIFSSSSSGTEVGTVSNFSALSVSLQMGYHSGSLSTNSTLHFNRDLAYDLCVIGKISEEIDWLLGLHYWKAGSNKTQGSVIPFHAETIQRKEIKLGLDFQLFKFFGTAFVFGQSVSFGSCTNAVNTVFSFAECLKLKHPVSSTRYSILTSCSYHKGMELFNSGGGINYSLFTYMLGVEININAQ